MARQRTPAERHEAWLAWRKRTVESWEPPYNDICPCKIGCDPLDEFKPTKCCTVCTGCNGRVKKSVLATHHKTCVAYKNFEKLCANLKPGDEFPNVDVPEDAVLGGSWVTCNYCKRTVRDRLETWHWRNNCEQLKRIEEERVVAGVHAAERYP